MNKLYFTRVVERESLLGTLQHLVCFLFVLGFFVLLLLFGGLHGGLAALAVSSERPKTIHRVDMNCGTVGWFLKHRCSQRGYLFVCLFVVVVVFEGIALQKCWMLKHTLTVVPCVAVS